MSTIYILFILSIISCAITEKKPLAVVIWHGMGDTADNSKIRILCQMIQDSIPGTYILDIKIGSSSFMDRLFTYFMPINKQLSLVCNILHSDKNLTDGFHLIGFSQAGLFVRAIAQRCPTKQLGSVISIGGPQQGIFGLPSCPDDTVNNKFCNIARRMLAKAAYLQSIQTHIVQAQYWHDPIRSDVYKQKSQFLAEINQENTVNETYKQNLMRVKNLVLIRFLNDSIVVPHISEWFGFYRDGQTKLTYNITESSQYTEDTLGLKTLHNQGKLHLISLLGDHLHFTYTWFHDVIIEKFLK